MFPRLIAMLALLGLTALALPTGRQEPLPEEVDSDETRRVLGSSVVTSVSVIMDLGHGGAALLSESPGQQADGDNAAGGSQQSETFANNPLSTQKRPVGSPPALMSPDRYEFYTFDESGELVRRLMTLEQIQSLIAGGDDAHRLAALTADLETVTPPSPSSGDPQEEVVANVQQVLAEELLASIQKNGSEPQEGEVEVEAVVQEVPPPPSSPKPELGSAEGTENASEGSHEDSETSSHESDDASGSTDASSEDSGSHVDSVDGSTSSSQESDVGEESGGDEDSGMTTDSAPNQDVMESSSEDYSDHHVSLVSHSSTVVPIRPGDKEKPSTPSTVVSEEYEAHEINTTPQSSSVQDNAEVSTLIYGDKFTTMISHTESSVVEEESTSSKHPEMPSMNKTSSGKINASALAVPIGDSEGNKATLADKTNDQSHTISPGGFTEHAGLTNKNPPTVILETQPEDSDIFLDPIPEIILTPTNHRPGQTDEPLGIEENEKLYTTTDSNKVVSEEPVIVPIEYSPSFDPQVDEIPNISHTTDFQPPEEADLSAFFPVNNQTSDGATDVQEEDPMKIQGLLGLFSDKFSSLMGASDTFNEAGDQHTITTEAESSALQGDNEEPYQSEIQDPSASLLPPLFDEDDNSTATQLGGMNPGVTEISSIKDTTTEVEVDQEDSDLLDELAESVSGILSQVSDFVVDSEDDDSDKPIAVTVHTIVPPSVNSAEGITSVEYKEKNTTPAPTSSVEVLSEETSTHGGHADEEEMEMLGEGSTSANGIHASESVKPDHSELPASSPSSYPTETFTEGSPATHNPVRVNDDSSTMSSADTDDVTSSSVEESVEDVTDIDDNVPTTEAPIKEKDGVEIGADHVKSTVPPEDGTSASAMDTAHLSGGPSTSSTETSEGDRTKVGTPIEVSVGDSATSMENSDADERFESSTIALGVEGGFEGTATTQGYVSDNGSTEKLTDGADTSNNYASESATTDNIHSGDTPVGTSEKSTDVSSPIQESVTHGSTQEHSTVSSQRPVMKPLPNKTDDEYLLEELHKVAEAESDPLLSSYADDELHEEQSSSLKDKGKPVSGEQNVENGDEDKEVSENGTEVAMTTDSSDLPQTTTEADHGEEEQPSTPPTESAVNDELPSPSVSPDESEREGETVRPITSENEEQSVDSEGQTPSNNGSKDDPSFSANNLITPTSSDSIKPTTYRPVYIPLSTPNDINDPSPSASPDELPDPNGLLPLLGENKEPVLVNNKPSDDALPSPTEKTPTVSTAASSSPGGSSVVPPLMPALPPAPNGNVGLEATSSSIDPDVKLFVDLCNDLAFSLYSQVTGASQSVPNIRGTHGSGVQTRSLVVSPFAISSLLAMVFLGARGPTSEQMNDLLHLDDVVTFNPHLVLQNVTESVITSPGVSAAAFVRELYSDKSKGHLLEFYKARAKAFYEGHVEEVDFKDVNDVIRRRTNHLVRWQTRGRVPEYLRGSSLRLRPPLAALSANFFEADCQRASSLGTDGEMYFEVPAMGRRRRRLVPIPAVVWRGVFLAGYDPGLDATVLELRHGGGEVSTVLVLPGRHGQSVSDDPTGGLSRLETWLAKGGKVSWSSLLRSAVPRGPIEVQLPRFAHRSVLNVTGALTRMGLHDLFTGGRADLRGLDGGLGGSLHLSDAIQMTAFGVCAEDGNSRRHLETYPSAQRTGRAGGEEGEEEEEADEVRDGAEGTTTPTETTTTPGEESTTVTPEGPPREGRSAAWREEEGLDEQSYAFAAAEAARELPLALRPRQARIPRPPQGSGVVLPRLRFDRPFLYFVRHNPSGFILLMGRFNPRLFP